VASFFGLVTDVEQAARETVEAIRSAPWLPKHLPVHAVLMDISTGALKLLERGYDQVFK
jgi:carbonic anhydrase